MTGEEKNRVTAAAVSAARCSVRRERIRRLVKFVIPSNKGARETQLMPQPQVEHCG